MSHRTRVLVALAVIALVSPLLPTATAIHVLLDHDHAGDPHGLDGESGLHGHSHPSGTPPHEHGFSAPALGTSGTREHEPSAFVVSNSVAPVLIATQASNPRGSGDAVARASPAIRLASVLRV